MTTSSKLTVLVGGAGKTGRRVAARLQARGHAFRLASRSSSPAFDWNDEATWPAALRGADALYLTYAPDLAVPTAGEHVRKLSELAVASGIRRIVLLAGRGEPQVLPAEQAVRASGAAYTILECAFFAQNFTEGLLAPIDDQIVFPADSVAEPFIDCDDIADVVVAALTEPGHDGKTYDLTGPRLLTFAEATAELARATGRPLRYVPVSFEAYAALLAHALPADEVGFLVGLFRELLDGHNAKLSDDVARVLGRPARDLRELVAEVR